MKMPARREDPEVLRRALGCSWFLENFIDIPLHLRREDHGLILSLLSGYSVGLARASSPSSALIALTTALLSWASTPRATSSSGVIAGSILRVNAATETASTAVVRTISCVMRAIADITAYGSYLIISLLSSLRRLALLGSEILLTEILLTDWRTLGCIIRSSIAIIPVWLLLRWLLPGTIVRRTTLGRHGLAAWPPWATLSVEAACIIWTASLLSGTVGSVFIFLDDHMILKLQQCSALVLGNAESDFSFPFELEMIYVMLYVHRVGGGSIEKAVKLLNFRFIKSSINLLRLPI